MPNVSSPQDSQPWPAADYYDDAPLWTPSGLVLPTGQALPTSYAGGDFALSLPVAAGAITPGLSLGRARVGGMRYRRTVTPWSSGLAGGSPDPGSDAYPLNSNANPRIDRLVLRRDLAAGKVYPLILLGTPAASPAVPALTRVDGGVWDLPLHRWQLAGSSSTAITNITDERRWMSASGEALSGLLPVGSNFTAGAGRAPTWYLQNNRVWVQGAVINTPAFTPPSSAIVSGNLPYQIRPGGILNFACAATTTSAVYNLQVDTVGGVGIQGPNIGTNYVAGITWALDGASWALPAVA
jgi:hypothetical protein